MQEHNKPVILGEKTTVLLWGFKVNARDRRNGNVVEGYIVVTGNEDYDIDAAQDEIRQKYSRIGYDVVVCEFDETRTFVFDALEIFKSAPPERNRCKYCDYYIEGDSSVGELNACELEEDDELKEDEPENYRNAMQAFSNNGAGCPLFELSSHAKKEPEDKPDYLAEIMATLAELEEQEERAE